MEAERGAEMSYDSMNEQLPGSNYILLATNLLQLLKLFHVDHSPSTFRKASCSSKWSNKKLMLQMFQVARLKSYDTDYAELIPHRHNIGLTHNVK